MNYYTKKMEQILPKIESNINYIYEREKCDELIHKLNSFIYNLEYFKQFKDVYAPIMLTRYSEEVLSQNDEIMHIFEEINKMPIVSKIGLMDNIKELINQYNNYVIITKEYIKESPLDRGIEYYIARENWFAMIKKMKKDVCEINNKVNNFEEKMNFYYDIVRSHSGGFYANGYVNYLSNLYLCRYGDNIGIFYKNTLFDYNIYTTAIYYGIGNDLIGIRKYEELYDIWHKYDGERTLKTYAIGESYTYTERNKKITITASIDDISEIVSLENAFRKLGHNFDEIDAFSTSKLVMDEAHEEKRKSKVKTLTLNLSGSKINIGQYID